MEFGILILGIPLPVKSQKECGLSNQSVGLQSGKLHQGNTKLLGAMLTVCLHDLSKQELKQIPEGGYRKLNSALSEGTDYIYSESPDHILQNDI